MYFFRETVLNLALSFKFGVEGVVLLIWSWYVTRDTVGSVFSWSLLDVWLALCCLVQVVAFL